MAFDNFNTASSPLASPWTTFGGGINNLQATGGRVAVITAATASAMYYSTSSQPYSRVRIAVVGGSDGGPGVHMVADGAGVVDGYVVTGVTGTTIILRRYDNSTPTQLGSVAGTYTAGDVLTLRSSGSNVIVNLNGTDIITVSDNTYRAGNPGIYMQDGTIRFDDWTDTPSPYMIGTPVDSISGGGVNTTSFTIPAIGARRALVVFTEQFSENTLGSVTWNGVSMGAARISLGNSFGEGLWSMWILTNPDTGTHDIVYTCGAANEIIVAASAWIDVNQASPLGNTDSEVSAAGLNHALSFGVSGSNIGIGCAGHYNGGVIVATPTDTVLSTTDGAGGRAGVHHQYGDGSLGWTLDASAVSVVLGGELVHDGGGGAAAALEARDVGRMFFMLGTRR